jgi:hypothetical protein
MRLQNINAMETIIVYVNAKIQNIREEDRVNAQTMKITDMWFHWTNAKGH